jgi:hypothetical protein
VWFLLHCVVLCAAFAVLQGALAQAMAKRRGVISSNRGSVSMPAHPLAKRMQAMSSQQDDDWED